MGISAAYTHLNFVAFLEKLVDVKLLLGQDHILSGNSVNIQKVQENRSL